NIYSVPKAGGPGVLIAQIPSNVAPIGLERVPLWNSLNFNYISLAPQLIASGENVWYQTPAVSGGNPADRLRILHGAGTNQQIIEGARIASWCAAPLLPWMWQARQAHTLYVAEGAQPNALEWFGSKPVKAYDGETRAVRFTLGTLPNASLGLQPDFNQPARA